MATDYFPAILGIDFDAETSWLGKSKENANRPVLLSRGRYAVEEGLEYLLALLDQHNIKATFFTPGLVADLYPKKVKLIYEKGHEVGSHNYRHRSITLLSPEEEWQELTAGIEALQNVTGEKPVSWRSPSWEFSKDTFSYLLKAGIQVSANFQDRTKPYRHVIDGKPIPLVEIPVHWHMADAPYFLYDMKVHQNIYPASAVYDLWKDEFLGLYKRPDSLFHLTLHVQLISHPGRLEMLDCLLAYMKSFPRVKFMTCREVAALVP